MTTRDELPSDELAEMLAAPCVTCGAAPFGGETPFGDPTIAYVNDIRDRAVAGYRDVERAAEDVAFLLGLLGSVHAEVSR